MEMSIVDSMNLCHSIVTGEMGSRKWEDLPHDCLVNIAARVGEVSRVKRVPVMCKSWRQATHNPLCWQSLYFRPRPSYSLPGPSYSLPDDLKEFVKFVIRRSCGFANVVVFSPSFPMTQELLDCIGEGCPSLKRLVLPKKHTSMIDISSVICKWKNLEALEIHRGYCLEYIIREINVHCKAFTSLTITRASINKCVATALTTLPNLKFLSLWGSWISRSDLMIILEGCKNLVQFDAGVWKGFVLDAEIEKLAAHIVPFDYVPLKYEQSAEYFDHQTGWTDYNYGGGYPYGSDVSDGDGSDETNDADREYWLGF